MAQKQGKMKDCGQFAIYQNLVIRSHVEWEGWTKYTVVLFVIKGGGEGGNIVLRGQRVQIVHTHADTPITFSDTRRALSPPAPHVSLLPLFFCPAFSLSIFLSAFLYSPPTHSPTLRPAPFLLCVGFSLPQSLFSCLLSIPGSARNQVNEEKTQSFGNVKKRLDASLQRARGHFNSKY